MTTTSPRTYSRPITTRLLNQIRLVRQRATTARRLEFRLRAEGQARAYATVLRWIEEDERRREIR